MIQNEYLKYVLLLIYADHDLKKNLETIHQSTVSQVETTFIFILVSTQHSLIWLKRAR